LPLLDPLARGLERLMPQRVAATDPAAPLYLDEAALYLLSPRSSYVTGALIPVSGGYR
jgi:NAD(P)-dependent dehydrogenase (short-subunit alcohol dehydrogenase family)